MQLNFQVLILWTFLSLASLSICAESFLSPPPGTGPYGAGVPVCPALSVGKGKIWRAAGPRFG